jgi:TnpA family transposase
MGRAPSPRRMRNALAYGPVVSSPPITHGITAIRYYGYYEKAIGIYTHISDQSAVFSTRVISCSPREALYVLDGLLDNNTIRSISRSL